MEVFLSAAAGRRTSIHKSALRQRFHRRYSFTDRERRERGGGGGGGRVSGKLRSTFISTYPAIGSSSHSAAALVQ